MNLALRTFTVLGLVAVGLGLSAGVAWQDEVKKASGPSELATQLAPHMRLYRPDGDGPFPTVLQFHGCGSSVASQNDWASFLAESGYMAIIVDSLGPRGIGREEAITTVCTALQLRGVERAGDILAALHAVRDMDDVDTDNLFLAGWSHGGWSIMDLLTLDLETEPPPNLTSASSEDLADIRGAVLIYPYCGMLSRSRSKGWHTHLDALMVIGGRDTVAPARQCARTAERLTNDGISIRSVLYDEATHAFDVSIHERFQRGEYNEELTTAARNEVLGFLNQHLAP